MYSEITRRNRKKTQRDLDLAQKNTIKNHFKNQTSNFIIFDNYQLRKINKYFYITL